MSKKIIRSPRVQEDILAAYLHIALDNQVIAEEFLDAIDELLDRLLTYPDMGARLNLQSSRLQDLRLIRVSPKFDRYLVFYHSTDDGIHVIRVLHRFRDIESLFMEEHWVIE